MKNNSGKKTIKPMGLNFAIAELAQPIPAEVIDLETKPLPVGMGGTMQAYTANTLPEKRY